MIKIVGPKKTDRSNEENKNSVDPKNPKSNPAYHRLTKDLSQIDIPKNAVMNFPNKDDITNFEVTVKPEDGSFWYGGTYHFSVSVPNDYPHEPPKIICNTKV
jgi:ubiquitin-conjugating enzyme E2 M